MLSPLSCHSNQERTNTTNATGCHVRQLNALRSPDLTVIGRNEYYRSQLSSSEDDVFYTLNNSFCKEIDLENSFLYETSSTKTSSLTCKDGNISFGSAECSLTDCTDNDSVLSRMNSCVLRDKTCSLIEADMLLHERCKRWNVAVEILDTERTYLSGLRIIMDHFFNPILDSLSTSAPILSKTRISDIFSNFIDIFNFNTKLLKMLEERLDPFNTGTVCNWDPRKDCLGDIFLQMGPSLKIYSIYCLNFSSALSAIEHEFKENSQFNAFIKKSELKKVCNGLDLQSYLLSIVQRIPRYKLLLYELLRYTDKNHQDYQELSKAFCIIEEIAILMNETIRQYENWIMMSKIQRSLLNLDEPLLSIPTRYFIKQGFVYKFCRRTHQKKILFLFNDCLIYATPATFLNISEKIIYYFNFRLPLDTLHIDDEFYMTKGINNAWRISSSKRSLNVCCNSSKEKEDWMKIIKNTKNEYLISKKTFQIISCKNMKNPVKLSQKYLIINNYSTPIWVRDSSTHKCMLCFGTFNWIRRKHHCRFCGKIVCHECSTNNFLILKETLPLEKKSVSYFYSLFLRMSFVSLDKTKENSNPSKYRILRVCDLCYFSKVSEMDDQQILNGSQFNLDISQSDISQKESLFDRNLPTINKTSMPIIRSIRIKAHGCVEVYVWIINYNAISSS
ncbi:hypothetical protein PMAC_002069 [Pneumocystis sp. 'macacae']|nr:hypothetical protein PMAC_002069 [Pneumocystis sp. 'macacae']